MELFAWSMLGLFFFLVGRKVWQIDRARYRARRRREIVNTIILQLKQSGLKFYMKTVNGVTGVTRSDTHKEGEREHHFLVQEGKLEGWDKVVIYASPTFTFAVDEQSRRPIHTGVMSDLQQIAADIVRQRTGSILAEFTEKEQRRILDAIVLTDNRLYVPYSGKDEDGRRDFERYGKTTLEEARRSFSLAP